MNAGNIAVGATLRFTFNTSVSGVPTTLAGSPAIACYKDGGLVQSTAGLTLSVDHDGVTGLHQVTVNAAADATFYSAASDFSVVLSAGTLGGASVVGSEAGSFSIQNRYAADVAVLDLVTLVKAKTDNLPTDPADQSLVGATMDLLSQQISQISVNEASIAATVVAAVLAQFTATSTATVIRKTPGTPDTRLFIGNDHSVEVLGLHDEATGTYFNSATVTAALKHLNGAEVAGETWPITLDYVGGSSGDYRGTLDEDLVLVNGKFYILEITADAGGGLIAKWRKEISAQNRTF